MQTGMIQDARYIVKLNFEGEGAIRKMFCCTFFYFFDLIYAK